MKRSRFVTDFSVGFVLFVATIIVITALFFVESGWSVFSDCVEYKVRLPTASGLIRGSRVYLSGIDVGSVSNIRLPQDLSVRDVEVTLRVDKAYEGRIRHDSYAWLQNIGLLGDVVVCIKAGTVDHPPCLAGCFLEHRSRSLVDELVGEGTSTSTADLLQETLQMLTQINRGQGTIGQLLKNPELYDNLNSFTAAMKETTRKVQGLAGEFEDVVKEVRTQKGTLGKLIFSDKYAEEFESALKEARRTLENVDSIAGNVARGEGTLGKILADPRLYERSVDALESISVAAARVEKVLTAVDEGEGSLGMLLHDPSIAASLRDLFLGVKELGLVQSIVRNAEHAGREAYLRDVDLTLRERREVLRARALAAIETSGTSGRVATPASGGEKAPSPATPAEGTVRPATLKQDGAVITPERTSNVEGPDAEDADSGAARPKQ